MSRGSGRMKRLPVLDPASANSTVLTVGRPEYTYLQQTGTQQEGDNHEHDSHPIHPNQPIEDHVVRTIGVP